MTSFHLKAVPLRMENFKTSYHNDTSRTWNITIDAVGVFRLIVSFYRHFGSIKISVSNFQRHTLFRYFTIALQTSQKRILSRFQARSTSSYPDCGH